MLAVFLDVETSGLDYFCHRVFEMAFKIIDMETGQERYTYNTVVKQPWDVWEARDPSSIGINGFTWEKLLGGKEESLVSQEIIDIFNQQRVTRGEAIYICQNPAFDRGFFSQLVNVYTQERYQWPYHWLDFASMYWAVQVKKRMQEGIPLPNESHLSKNAIAQQYHLPVESSPHSALNGVNHLILCYETVVGFPTGNGQKDERTTDKGT